jgi:hypothetical protein
MMRKNAEFFINQAGLALLIITLVRTRGRALGAPALVVDREGRISRAPKCIWYDMTYGYRYDILY